MVVGSDIKKTSLAELGLKAADWASADADAKTPAELGDTVGALKDKVVAANLLPGPTEMVNVIAGGNQLVGTQGQGRTT